MVFMGISSIRVEISELSVAKSGWTTLFVDKNYAAASDDNDGYSWSRPNKTIGGALADAKSWCKIYVNSGSYTEEVTVPYEHVQILGTIEDGPAITKIVATGGTALTITAGFCEIANIAIEATDQHGIQATTPGHHFHDMNILLANTTGVARTGIWLDNSDKTIIERCHIDGSGDAEVIGILIGDNTIEAEIRDNYITSCGDGIGVGCGAGGACTNNGYSVGIAISAQRCRVYDNAMIDNCVGVYLYADFPVIEAYKGHTIIHNEYYENCSFDAYDQYDPADATDPSGILIRENFFGYQQWFVDSDNSGRADIIIDCNSNKDFAPVANPRAWKTEAISRAAYI